MNESISLTSSTRWTTLTRNVIQGVGSGLAMDPVRLSQQLQYFFRMEAMEMTDRFGSIPRFMEMLAKFWYGLSIPSDWGLMEVERGEKGWYFHWRSRSDLATCPVCHTVSRRSTKR